MSAATEIFEEAAQVARAPAEPAPPSPRTRLARHLRTPLACLCYMAVLVAAAVGLDHVIAGRLFAHPTDYVPTYRSYPEYAVGSKLHQFEGTHTRFDGLFIGNSRTMFDVDPATFDGALAARGQRANTYNVAFPSIDPRFWPWYFQHDYSKPLPRHVFLGILSRDLEARNDFTTQFMAQFASSPGYAHRHWSGTNSWAEEALSRIFVLRGRAADLRDVTLADAVHGRKLDIAPIHLVGKRGWSAVPEKEYKAPAQLAAEQRRLAREPSPLRFELGPQWQSIVALSQWLRQRGSCLTLYTTPLLYDDDLWGTPEMHRAFYANLHRLLRATPSISFVDAGRQLQPRLGLSDYADGDHLDPAGAQVFSRSLASALAPSLASGCSASR